MEAIFDDIAGVLKAPQASLRDRYGAFALQLVVNAVLGLAIGLGFAAGRVILAG